MQLGVPARTQGKDALQLLAPARQFLASRKERFTGFEQFPGPQTVVCLDEQLNLVCYPHLSVGGELITVCDRCKGSLVKILRAISFVAGLALLLTAPARAAEFFVSPTGNHQAPYATWADAATNIQDAIDLAAPGDVVWVTNGVYSTGGKVVAGDLTNRVVLDKALTVQSVNGPTVTMIRGAGPRGPVAVRCAWLTNDSVLKGFTLQDGASRSAGDTPTLQSGGGAWCASSNAILANCVIRSNSATYGGGAFQGTLNSCALNGNSSISLTTGGGAYNAMLNNSTVCSNSTGVAGSFCRFTNCIFSFNGNNANYSGPGHIFSYCCGAGLPSGAGNIPGPPQLLTDRIHLASTSPCRGAGTNLIGTSDIDGQPWANPPCIGCDEWQPSPVTVVPPIISLTNDPVGFTISAVVAGQPPFTCWWTRDGTPLENDGHYSSAHTTTLVASGSSLHDAGNYQVVVSNAFGISTSPPAQVIVHYVDAAGAAPTPPYLSWANAATNIQDAIDAAASGEIVLVTNGVYGTGGRVMAGDLTNRVVLDKAVLVESVNGSAVTVIPGAWDPATNGLLSVRCAWLTNGATLSGFTLQGGATRPSTLTGDINLLYGGAVWGSSISNATVANCLIVSNAAAAYGGGAYRAFLLNCRLQGNRVVENGSGGGGAGGCNLKNCLVTGNSAPGGGGTTGSTLRNCAVTKNSAAGSGGGVASSKLVNCTVSGNVGAIGPVGGYGGGASSCGMTNCIVYANRLLNMSAINSSSTNYDSPLSTLIFSCSSPLPQGAGNIGADPQLLGDGIHLSSFSPCREAGTNSFILGTDLDGETWADPPSMGCDEPQLEPTIFVQPTIQFTISPFGFTISVVAGGQEPLTCFWTRDGIPIENDGHYSSAHTATLFAKGILPSDLGTYQVVVSNSFLVVTSAVTPLQLVFHYVDPGSPNPAPPYASWATASSNIQDAIEVALPGEIVLVTNGLYATGGKVMAGDLTNRVALTSAVTVTSVNGPAATIIRGAQDAESVYGGLSAVRCAWLADGATLNGFTLQGGATRTAGDSTALQSGGGVWCASANATVASCVLTNNASNNGGGGCYQGQLNRCLVVNNWSRYGGGCSQATLRNCIVAANTATFYGGGAYFGSMFHCTVYGNSAFSTGGGTYQASVRNCIVFYNAAIGFGGNNYEMFSRDYAYTCSSPLPLGTGNISTDPQLLDGRHLKPGSPCRGAGNAAYASGADVDGEAWMNPPSMGCDEVWEAALIGPLAVTISPHWSAVAEQRMLPLIGVITGLANRVDWAFGDGSVETNGSWSTAHSWTNPGDYTVTFAAFNLDHPAGVSTNLVVHVLPMISPTLAIGGLSGTNFHFSFPSQPGVIYNIDQTTNLTPPVTWQFAGSWFGDGTIIQFTDTQATNNSRFFRVRTQ